MIRFCDLREAYWLDPDYPEKAKGPFAFIDTVSNEFVEVAGIRLFDDAKHFDECVDEDARANQQYDIAFVERLRAFITGEFR